MTTILLLLKSEAIEETRDGTGLNLVPNTRGWRFYQWIVIFDMVSSQQEFITHPLRDYRSRKINEIDR